MYFKQIRHMIKYYLIIIGSAYLTIFAITHSIITPIYVNGTSMEPNIAEGTIGFSNIALRHLSGIERFDIIVFAYEDELMIKRVIALPHETIELKDDILYINGQAMEQPFLTNNVHTTDVACIRLSENEVYVLGDNRNQSMDSRVIGAIPMDTIIGKDIYAMR